MIQKLSKVVDKASEFLAARKGLLPLIGLTLIITNLVLKIVFSNWLTDTDLLLYIGLVTAIIGLMLAWTLELICPHQKPHPVLPNPDGVSFLYLRAGREDLNGCIHFEFLHIIDKSGG